MGLWHPELEKTANENISVVFGTPDWTVYATDHNIRLYATDHTITLNCICWRSQHHTELYMLEITLADWIVHTTVTTLDQTVYAAEEHQILKPNIGKKKTHHTFLFSSSACDILALVRSKTSSVARTDILLCIVPRLRRLLCPSLSGQIVTIINKQTQIMTGHNQSYLAIYTNTCWKKECMTRLTTGNK